MCTSERFGPLAEPTFRLFWTGKTASVIGDALMPVTIVFAILSVGGSASDIGLVLGTSLAVRVVLLVVGGTLADRVSRRLLILGCDVSLAVVQVVVCVLLATGRGSIWLLLAASVFYGVASALSTPALTGLVTQSIAKENSSRPTRCSASPPVKVDPVARNSKATFFRDLTAGWSEVASRPWYWMGLCCHALWSLGACVFLVLGPVIVNEMGGASGWGLVAASTATGSLLGGFVVLRWRPRRPLIVGHPALLLTALQLGSLIGPSPIVLIMASALTGAIGVALINQLWTTAIQRLIPEESISRVSSYEWLISMTVAPLGYALSGPLAEHAGTSVTLQTAMALVAASVIAVLLVPGIRAVRQGPDGSMFTGMEPAEEPAVVQH